jgi:hypothetical protein
MRRMRARSHRGKVGVELGFVVVVGNKHHLDLLRCSVALVPSPQGGRKCLARAAPMSAEVEHEDLHAQGHS